MDENEHDSATGAAASGDEVLSSREFERMTQDLAGPMFGAALRMTRNRAEAEDLVQDTLFRGFRSLHSFRAGTNFRAWIFRIMRNAFINRSKREAKAPTAVDPVDLRPSARDEVVPDLRVVEQLPDLADRHLDEEVKAAVDALPENFRMPLVLFSLGGMAYQEIADTLEIPIGTVMSRLHRARKQIRGQLAEYARERGYGEEGRS